MPKPVGCQECGEVESHLDTCKAGQNFMREYGSLLHAIQTGVKYKMEYDDSETTPKHLRVGVNSALVNHTAIWRLLVKKGVISRKEYEESLLEQLREEKAMYEAWLTERTGASITLG